MVFSVNFPEIRTSQTLFVLLFVYHNFVKAKRYISKWIRACTIVSVRIFKNIDYGKSKIFTKISFHSLSVNEHIKFTIIYSSLTFCQHVHKSKRWWIIEGRLYYIYMYPVSNNVT